MAFTPGDSLFEALPLQKKLKHGFLAMEKLALMLGEAMLACGFDNSQTDIQTGLRDITDIITSRDEDEEKTNPVETDTDTKLPLDNLNQVLTTSFEHIDNLFALLKKEIQGIASQDPFVFFPFQQASLAPEVFAEAHEKIFIALTHREEIYNGKLQDSDSAIFHVKAFLKQSQHPLYEDLDDEYWSTLPDKDKKHFIRNTAIFTATEQLQHLFACNEPDKLIQFALPDDKSFDRTKLIDAMYDTFEKAKEHGIKLTVAQEKLKILLSQYAILVSIRTGFNNIQLMLQDVVVEQTCQEQMPPYFMSSIVKSLLSTFRDESGTTISLYESAQELPESIHTDLVPRIEAKTTTPEDVTETAKRASDQQPIRRILVPIKKEQEQTQPGAQQLTLAELGDQAEAFRHVLSGCLEEELKQPAPEDIRNFFIHLDLQEMLRITEEQTLVLARTLPNFLMPWIPDAIKSNPIFTTRSWHLYGNDLYRILTLGCPLVRQQGSPDENFPLEVKFCEAVLNAYLSKDKESDSQHSTATITQQINKPQQILEALIGRRQILYELLTIKRNLHIGNPDAVSYQQLLGKCGSLCCLFAKPPQDLDLEQTSQESDRFFISQQRLLDQVPTALLLEEATPDEQREEREYKLVGNEQTRKATIASLPIKQTTTVEAETLRAESLMQEQALALAINPFAYLLKGEETAQASSVFTVHTFSQEETQRLFSTLTDDKEEAPLVLDPQITSDTTPSHQQHDTFKLHHGYPIVAFVDSEGSVLPVHDDFKDGVFTTAYFSQAKNNETIKQGATQKRLDKLRQLPHQIEKYHAHVQTLINQALKDKAERDGSDLEDVTFDESLTWLIKAVIIDERENNSLTIYSSVVDKHNPSSIYTNVTTTYHFDPSEDMPTWEHYIEINKRLNIPDNSIYKKIPHFNITNSISPQTQPKTSLGKTNIALASATVIASIGGVSYAGIIKLGAVVGAACGGVIGAIAGALVGGLIVGSVWLYRKYQSRKAISTATISTVTIAAKPTSRFKFSELLKQLLASFSRKKVSEKTLKARVLQSKTPLTLPHASSPSSSGSTTPEPISPIFPPASPASSLHKRGGSGTFATPPTTTKPPHEELVQQGVLVKSTGSAAPPSITQRLV